MIRLILVAVLLSTQAFAKIQTEEIIYQADIPLKGVLTYDDDFIEPKPALLVVHEWWGQNDHTRQKARWLAERGFVTFALDMFGDGKSTEHPAEAKEFMMQALQNQDIANKRFLKAYEVLQNHPKVLKNKIGAVGYCFGGKVVLDQARLGTQLMGVVSVHGNLSPLKEGAKKRIKTPILVLNGEDDPMVDDVSLINFAVEMTQKNAPLEFVSFKGATHAFTNSAATEMGKKHDLPLAYHPEADRESHGRIVEFFNDQVVKK